MLNDLKIDSGYWYLASPYSKYPGGIEEAARKISEIAGALLQLGIPVYSPIALTHAIAMAAGMDPLDHAIWLPADAPLMDGAHGMILTEMATWQDSYGLGVEEKDFNAAGKPIVHLNPRILGISP